MSKSWKIEFAGHTIKANYLDTKKDFLKGIDWLKKQNKILGLDIETYPLPEYMEVKLAATNPRKSKIRLVQIGNEDVVLVFDVKKVNLEILKPILEQKKFVSHAAMFETQHLRHHGINITPPHCTLLMWNLFRFAVYKEPKKTNGKLETVVHKTLKTKPEKDLGSSDWGRDQLTEDQLNYAALDAYFPVAAAKNLQPKLKKLGMLPFYKFYVKAQHPIVTMMLNGIKLDVELHNKHIEIWEKEITNQAAKLYGYFGVDTNLNSSKQLSEVLIDKLDKKRLAAWPRSEKTGHLKTNADTLALNADLPIVAPLLAYKKLQKLVTAFGLKLQNQRNLSTDRIHPSYTLSHTVTGRMSCSSPNLQQIPSRSVGAAMRDMFIAEDGWSFVGADYSQVELRAAAIESNDETMLHAFENDIDLHVLMACRLTDKPEASIDKSERTLAKIANFGLAYGMGLKKFRLNAQTKFGVNMNDEEAWHVIQTYRTTFKGLRRWQKQTVYLAEQKLTSRTRLGKLVRLHEDKFYNSSLNIPIQGGCAEVMLHALINIQNTIDNKGWKEDAKLLQSVHDEVTVSVREDKAKKFAPLLKRDMEKAMKTVYPSATLVGLIDVSIGKSWADLK